jgi:hypothetical protein
MKPQDNPYNDSTHSHKGQCQHPPGYLVGGDAKDGYKLKCRKCGKVWRS